MIDIGFKNYVVAERISYIITPKSARSRWLVKEALTSRMLINCTHGKKTGALIILSTGHIILSSLKATSIGKRLLHYPGIIEKLNLHVLDRRLIMLLEKVKQIESGLKMA